MDQSLDEILAAKVGRPDTHLTRGLRLTCYYRDVPTDLGVLEEAETTAEDVVETDAMTILAMALERWLAIPFPTSLAEPFPNLS